MLGSMERRRAARAARRLERRAESARDPSLVVVVEAPTRARLLCRCSGEAIEQRVEFRQQRLKLVKLLILSVQLLILSVQARVWSAAPRPPPRR